MHFCRAREIHPQNQPEVLSQRLTRQDALPVYDETTVNPIPFRQAFLPRCRTVPAKISAQAEAAGKKTTQKQPAAQELIG